MQKKKKNSNQILFKGACRVHITDKKHFVKIITSLVSVIKNGITLMYILCIYKNTIIVSLFKTDTLNFNVYILAILICPLKLYVIGLHYLISMNISSL